MLVLCPQTGRAVAAGASQPGPGPNGSLEDLKRAPARGGHRKRGGALRTAVPSLAAPPAPDSGPGPGPVVQPPPPGPPPRDSQGTGRPHLESPWAGEAEAGEGAPAEGRERWVLRARRCLCFSSWKEDRPRPGLAPRGHSKPPPETPVTPLWTPTAEGLWALNDRRCSHALPAGPGARCRRHRGPGSDTLVWLAPHIPLGPDVTGPLWPPLCPSPALWPGRFPLQGPPLTTVLSETL